MAIGDQINLRPEFETTTLPCNGKVGDLFVMTPLRDNRPDPEDLGSASLWVCLKGDIDGQRAVWKRVQFDGFARCDTGPVPTPPQDLERLTRG